MWKKEKKENLEEAAHAFEEYVATFQEDTSKIGKVWVKAGTFDAGRRVEDTRGKGQLYKPQSRLTELADKLSSAERAEEYARMMGEKKAERPIKKRSQGDKKKSNLEVFKEELKMIQEEREERHKYKDAVSSGGFRDVAPHITSTIGSEITKNSSLGSHDMGDPNTTNLYLANLNPTMTEQQLKEMFGRFGPLASIKIMWPRCDEDKARGSHCGFAAFMNRKDGERALKYLNGREIMGFKMKLGWGKAVPIPSIPIYIPPAMLELTTPPLPSGLPFNAQPHKKHKSLLPTHRNERLDMATLDDILPHAVVKVVIPNDRHLLMTIHRLIEFVIRGGPMFEAMIMNRELNNPMFKFLFENQSPVHVYYRWKLFSLLQGDTPYHWRTDEFCMFRTGSIWKPPPMELYTRGMPDELFQDDEDTEVKKGTLSTAQWDRLHDILHNVTPEKAKIAEVMVFCIEHSEAAEEICDAIRDSLTSVKTPIQKKIARLYLVSDILHNCGVRITNASHYRKGLEVRLMDIFKGASASYAGLGSHLKAEGFKIRVMKIFRAWEEWAVYPNRFLVALQNVFLGLTTDSGLDAPEVEEDINGAPLSEDEDLDGIPLDGAALLKGALKQIAQVPDEDIDGIPMEELQSVELKALPVKDSSAAKRLPAGFVPSRWETVDPEEIEAQAMTTSKWDQLNVDEGSKDGTESVDSDNPGGVSRDMDEARRSKLREVELKAVKYQDELEAGKQSLKSGWTIAEQVEHYRRKLLRRAEKEEKEKKKEDKSGEKEKGAEKERPCADRVGRKRSLSPTVSSKSNKGGGSPVSKRSRRSRSPSDQGSNSGKSRRSRSPRKRSRSRNSPKAKRSTNASKSPPKVRHASRAVTPSPPRIRYTPSPPRSKHRARSPEKKSSKTSRRIVVDSPSPPRSKRSIASPRRHKHK